MTAPSLQCALFPPLPGREHGDVTVLSLCGDLDVSDAPALHAWLRGVRWQRRPRSVVDLTGLAFIDCACLGVLIRHAWHMRARGGTLALAGPQGAVLRILSVTGLLGWFEVYDTIGQATTGGGAGYQSLTFPAPSARSSPAGAFSGPGWAQSATGAVTPEVPL
jgi:anti-sigma B factor antagonist